MNQPSIIEQPFLIEEDCNKYAFDNLIKALRDRNVFAFIGAGCSKGCKYPLWDELLIVLEERVKKLNPSIRLEDYQKFFQEEKIEDKLWYAEVLKSKLPPVEFHNLIRNIFQPKEIADWSLHQDLISINFSHYLTTNYDSLLEDAKLVASPSLDYFCWNNKERLKEFFEAIHNPNGGNRCVFHIHGRFDDERSIIFTERDYLEMYIQDILGVKVLERIVSAYSMCFIGFGMNDLDVLTVFRKAWWEFGRGHPRHFAFMKQNDLNKRIIHRQYLRDKYGIDAIFFSTDEKTQDPYAEFKKKISDLAAQRASHADMENDIAKVNEITGLNFGA